jgi:hypothetical protein
MPPLCFMHYSTYTLLLLTASPNVAVYAQSKPRQLIAAVDQAAPVLLAPGDSTSRQFGDLVLCFRLLRPPTAVRCTAYIETQLAGVRQLSTDTPSYTFNLRVGLGRAYGTLTFQPVSTQQGLIATLAGNFSYSAPDSTTPFAFQGDLFGWYAHP